MQIQEKVFLHLQDLGVLICHYLDPQLWASAAVPVTHDYTKLSQFSMIKENSPEDWNLSFHKNKFLLKDVALIAQEKSCICLENKEIMRATRSTSLQCLFDIPWPWPEWPPVWENTCFRLCLFISLCWDYQQWHKLQKGLTDVTVSRYNISAVVCTNA